MSVTPVVRGRSRDVAPSALARQQAARHVESPSPPSSRSTSRESQTESLHIAYTRDDIHQAKILLLRLKGISVVDSTDDPRISTIQPEDFDDVLGGGYDLQNKERQWKAEEDNPKRKIYREIGKELRRTKLSPTAVLHTQQAITTACPQTDEVLLSKQESLLPGECTLRAAREANLLLEHLKWEKARIKGKRAVRGDSTRCLACSPTNSSILSQTSSCLSIDSASFTTTLVFPLPASPPRFPKLPKPPDPTLDDHFPCPWHGERGLRILRLVQADPGESSDSMSRKPVARSRIIPNPMFLRLQALKNLLLARGLCWEGRGNEGMLGSGRDKIEGIAYDDTGRSPLANG